MNKIIYRGEWSFVVEKKFVLDPLVPPIAKIIYIALQSYCSPNQSTCFPSASILGVALGINRTTFDKYTSMLEDMGYVSRKQVRTKGGKWSHTLWTLRSHRSPNYRQRSNPNES